MKFVSPWTVHRCTVHWEKSTFAATVQWTVAALLKNAWKQKKKKKKERKEQNAASHKRRRSLSAIQTSTTCSFANFLITGAMKGYKEEREWEEHEYNTFVSHKVAPASKLLLTSYNLTHYNICICLQNNTVENRKLDLSG